MFRIIYTVLLLSLCISLSAASSKPELSSDNTIEFDEKSQRLIARGNAELVHEDFFFKADEISFLQLDNAIEARNRISLTQDSMRLVADRISYRITDRSFESGPFRLGEYPLYLVGDSLEGNPDEIQFMRNIMYLNEPDPFSFNIKSRSLNYYPGDKVQVKHATFRIGKVPFFYLPSYEQSIRETPIRFNFDAGYRGNLGAYVRTSTLFPINESLKAGANLDYYSERGVLVGPAAKYDYTFKPGHTMRGSLESGYISDSGDRDQDILGNDVPEDRGFIEWKHKQKIGEIADITAQVNYRSDSEVERDFRPDAFRDNQEPDSFIEAIHAGDNYFISAFSRFHPNNFQIVDERLPEVGFDLLPTPIGATGLFHQFNADYAHLKQNGPGLPDLRSDRFNGFYQLSRPFKLTNWLNIKPIAGGQITHYGDAIGSQYTRLLGQLGFDAEATASSTWKYKNKTWGIDGLRHVLRPILRYRYIPEADQGQGRIPQIDDQTFNTSLPIIDLGELRNLDELQEIHVMRLGLENLLQTRYEGNYGSRQLAALNLYQDIRFSKEPGEKTFSNFFTDLELTPIHWFKFNLFNRFDPEELTMEETRTSATITDGDIWELSVSTENLQREIDQYFLDFDYKLNERWLFQLNLGYDTRLNSFTKQEYSVITYLGNSWEVEFEVAFYEGSERENQTQFNINFRLMNL